MVNRIIINADDYGRSKEINAAINTAFEQGLITDTSIMATCKDGLDDLVENIDSYNHNLIIGAGCHLCLTLGKPLTKGILNTRYVEGNELVDSSKLPKRLTLSKSERKVIYEELQVQIREIREKLHIQILHIDSHQHIHFGLDLLPLVVKLCKHEHIPYLRIPSYSKELSVKSKIATLLKIWYIRLNGIKVVDLFGSPNQIVNSPKRNKKIVEAMVHPMFNSNGEIVNKVRIHEANDCQKLSKDVERLKCFERTSYRSL